MSDAVGPHPDPRELAAFDAGALAPAARSEVERHVGSCADCCRTLDGLPEDDFVARMRRGRRARGAARIGGPPPLPRAGGSAAAAWASCTKAEHR